MIQISAQEMAEVVYVWWGVKGIGNKLQKANRYACSFPSQTSSRKGRLYELGNCSKGIDQFKIVLPAPSFVRSVFT